VSGVARCCQTTGIRNSLFSACACSFCKYVALAMEKTQLTSPYLDLRQMDCMELMKKYPDKHFDLAIVDPPYFDVPQKAGYYKGTKQVCDVGDYKDLSGSWWIPDQTYFDELKRVSKNQIIWGINYFKSDLAGGAIVWVKGEQGSLIYLSIHGLGFGKKLARSGKRESTRHKSQLPFTIGSCPIMRKKETRY
jgi:hypothetical protein